MKKYKGKITAIAITAILIIATVYTLAFVQEAQAAPATATILPVMNPQIKNYSYVFAQVYDKSGTMVFDVTAADEAGAMAARSSTTFADTGIAVTLDTDFYVGELKFPTALSGGRGGQYIVRIWGSSDATFDKDDTQIAAMALKFKDGILVAFSEQDGLPESF